MTININDIKIGSYYSAGKNCDQLRKVTNIEKDDQGRNRITYLSKSIKIPNRKFDFAATIANPALESTFAEACCAELTASHISNLRDNKILLTGE